jgi:outer membrane protein insertion porin family
MGVSKLIYGLSLGLLWLILGAAGLEARAGTADEKGEASRFIAALEVRIQAAPRHRSDWEAMARELIPFQAGDPWRPGLVEAAREALNQSRCFQSIEIDPRLEPGGQVVRFNLTPFHRIRAIRIEGQEHLFADDIRKVMTLRVGGPLVAAKLAAQETLIRNLFLREGFVDPKVAVTHVIDPEDQRALVTAAIQAGPFYRWEELNFSGNAAFSEARLKARMASWDPLISFGAGRRFVERKLREDIRDLLTFYREKGYAEAELDAELNPEPAKARMAVAVAVKEGPKYEVTFAGNESLSSRVLKKELVLFDQGNRRDSGLRKSLRNIRNRYRAEGFADVAVSLAPERRENADPGTRKLEIAIQEGPRTRVSQITITGNHALPTARLLGSMATAPRRLLRSGVFVSGVLQNDLAQIRALYLEEGHLKVSLTHSLDYTPDHSRVAIRIEINEGPAFTVSSIRFSGLSTLTLEAAQAALELKLGTPFRSQLIPRDETSLAALISETGHPHVQVKGSAALDETGSGVALDYEIEEGPEVRLGPIYFMGNQRTRAWRLNQVAELSSGEPFSLRRIAEAKRNLVALEVWNSVTLTPVGLEDQRTEVPILVQLEERKPFFVEAGAGYESDRGLFGELALGDHNALGLGQYGRALAQISEIGYRGELALRYPRLAGTPFEVELGAYSERKEEFNLDFGTTVWGLYGNLQRERFHNLDIGLALALEHRDQFSKTSGSGLFSGDEGDSRDPRTIFTVAPFVILDLRDSFIRPRKGLYSHLQLDFSNGFENDLDDFTKLRWDLKGYISPWSRLTLAALGRIGNIRPWGGSDQVPEDQLFYLGGIRDVRGFDENLLWRDENGDALGGKHSAAGSLEARLDLGRNLELTLFYDIGRLSRATQVEESSSDWRESAGLGLWYHTPVGPIGVLYGWKLDRRSGEDPGQFHFSIGYTF